MLLTRINARLSGPMASFVEKMTGADGLFETSSEYIRDLIRRDMERRAAGRQEDQFVRDSLLTGYEDMAAGKSFASTGDFHKDMKILTEKESTGWR